MIERPFPAAAWLPSEVSFPAPIDEWRRDAVIAPAYRIRPMRSADAARVAALSTDLGYPSSSDEIAERFACLGRGAEFIVLVAEADDGNVIGWVHAHGRYLLDADSYVELGGLIVDRSSRRLGVGRALLDEVERWTREHGFSAIRVRANRAREEAESFYRGVGFERIKVQNVFHRPLK